MIVLVIVLMATYVEAGGQEVCLAKQEESHFTNLEKQLKGFEKTIGDLKKGLKGKHVLENDGCRKDWNRLRDYCYFFSKQQKSWFEAERYCRTKGSSLAHIIYEDENTFVMSKFKKAHSNLSHAWIGATNGDAGKWIWVSNLEPVKYFKWNPREPNSKSGDVACVEMYPIQGGVWNDQSCSRKFVFVCKRHVKNGCPSNQE